MSKKMPDESQHCMNCMYFMENEGRGYYCRRYPPQIAFELNDDGGGQCVTAWPAVDPDEWCGAYDPV